MNKKLSLLLLLHIELSDTYVCYYHMITAVVTTCVAGQSVLNTITEGNDPDNKSEHEEGNAANVEAHSTPQPPSAAIQFDSYESAYEHYRVYAQRKGFGVRKDYSRTTVDGQLSRAMVVCYKADKPHMEKEDTQNPKSIVKKRKRSKIPRTGYPAHMYVKRVGSWWHVADFDDTHNHPLMNQPALAKFLRSHRYIPQEEKEFISLLHNSNVPTRR